MTVVPLARTDRSAASTSRSSRPAGTVEVDAQDGSLREIALRAGRGDADALSELLRMTSRQVWWVCATLVDRGSADDLAQDTYLRAVRSLPGYRGDADPVRWLLTIARRVCADEIARRQRRRHSVAQLLPNARTRPSSRPIGTIRSRVPRARRDLIVALELRADAADHPPVGETEARDGRRKRQCR